VETETGLSALVETETGFRFLVFGALVETETGLSALVETETGFRFLDFRALVETETGFRFLVFGALVETETGFRFLDFRALVETETGLSALVEMGTWFWVRRGLQFRFLGGWLKVAGGANRGGGGVDSCGGCDVVSMATCAASAVDWMCGCGEALAKAVWAASAVSGKCQRRGPVSSRQPERRGWPSG